VSQGVLVDLILKTADWCTESVFTRFYRGDAIAYEQCFSSVVLTFLLCTNICYHYNICVSLIMHNESCNAKHDKKENENCTKVLICSACN
jgi:hypothetical protein